jgi:hypothetical protein
LAGLVTGISPGISTIKVTSEDGGFTDTCMVKVTAPVKPVEFTVHIGPEGGTITEPRGTVLTIPAGALSHDTAITVITYLNADEISKIYEISPFISGVELLPHGITFTQPLTVTVPVEELLIPDSTYDIFIHPSGDSEWNPLLSGKANKSGDHLTFLTDHFSILSVSPWFSGSLELFPEALGSTDCISELAISNFINAFVNNHGTHLFDMKKIIEGVTYNISGVNFDFKYTCDQDKGESTRLLGHTSGITTIMTDSIEMESNRHLVISNLRITLYWAIWTNPDFQSIFISERIPRTLNDPQNLNYYSTMISIPAQLPETGNFYFSISPGEVASASIDGYISFNNTVIDVFDLTVLPREMIEPYKGSSLKVDLWAYKSEEYHENSAIWIVWGP